MLEDEKTLQTGLKLILLLEFLYNGDCAKDEILSSFTKFYNIKISQETLKLYVNTLLEAGFKIKRGNRKNNFKMHLEKDFSLLKLTQKELILLDSVKNYVFEAMDINKIIALKSFYERLLPLTDENGAAILKNFRFFNLINKRVLNSILKLNNTGKQVKVRYISPKRGVVEITCKLNGASFIEGKLYLRCATEYLKEDMMLRADNIYGIFKTEEQQSKKEAVEEKLKYKIAKEYLDSIIPDDKEKIVRLTKDEAEIETKKTSDFFTVQKLILAGKNCTYINNDNIKNKIIAHLSEILEQYE